MTPHLIETIRPICNEFSEEKILLHVIMWKKAEET